jgi:competence protein ComEC
MACVWCLPGRDGQKRGLLREFLSAQGVATVGLLPLTVMLFGQASLAGPLANLLAIPVWSLVAVPLALSGLLAEVLWPGGGGSLAMGRAMLRPDMARVRVVGIEPVRLVVAARGGVVRPAAGLVWCVVAAVAAGRAGQAIGLPVVAAAVVARHLPARGEAELLVMDVGQGWPCWCARQRMFSCTTPARLSRRVRCGRAGRIAGDAGMGSGRADRIVVSHADADHAGGLAALRRSMPRADVLASPQAPVTGGRVRGRGGMAMGRRALPLLHPSPGFPYLRNESSCVLRIETAHGTALLTGDIGEAIEHRLLRGRLADLHADIVLVPHHGSGAAADPFHRRHGCPIGLGVGGARQPVRPSTRGRGASLAGRGSRGVEHGRQRRLARMVHAGRAACPRATRWRARWWDAAGRVRATAILSTDD